MYGAQLFQAVRWQGASVAGLTCYNLGCYATGSGVNIQAVNGSFFVNGSTYTVSGGSMNLPSATTYAGAQIMVTDSMAGSKGQLCTHTASSPVTALAMQLAASGSASQ